MPDTTFPESLYSSPDFGNFDIVLAPSAFKLKAEKCKEEFGEGFKPTYTEWVKVEDSDDLYSLEQWNGRSLSRTIKVQATWSVLDGSFKLREIEED